MCKTDLTWRKFIYWHLIELHSEKQRWKQFPPLSFLPKWNFIPFTLTPQSLPTLALGESGGLRTALHCCSFLFALFPFPRAAVLQNKPASAWDLHGLQVPGTVFHFLTHALSEAPIRGWGAELCPAVGLLEAAGTGCVRHPAAPAAEHRGRPGRASLLLVLTTHVRLHPVLFLGCDF